MRANGLGSLTDALHAQEVALVRSVNGAVLAHVAHLERLAAGAADLLLPGEEAPAHLTPAAHSDFPQHRQRAGDEGMDPPLALSASLSWW